MYRYHEHESKDYSRAVQYREKGSQLYKESKFYDALEFYNKSLCYALTGSEDIALAYGNRSAVYLEIKEFDKCLENIKLARDAGYPKDKLERLRNREQRCNEQKQLHQPNPDDDPWNFFQLTYPGKKSLSTIGDCLELRENRKYGRHIVASRNLNPGDIISIESTPFKALHKSGSFIRCANCFKSNKMSLIPFATCASAMFCSQECLDEGRDKYVCAVDEEKSFAPRTTLQALETVGGDFSKLEYLMTDPKLRSKTAFDVDLTDPNDPDFKYKQLLAFNGLTENRVEASENFFKSHPILKRWSSEREKKIIANFMIHVNRRWKCGSKSSFIQQYRRENYNNHFRTADDFNFIVFGSAVYLHGYFFSHSCCPNTDNIHLDDKFITAVSHPIKKGEQIFVSYGPLFHQPIEERQDYLDTFNFTCSCTACKKNWSHLNFPPAVDKTAMNKLPLAPSTSYKEAKENYERSCAYVLKTFKNYPCREIIFLRTISFGFLLYLAKTKKFLFEKIY